MAFPAVDVEQLAQPVGKHCGFLFDTFAAALGAGDNPAAAVVAEELGRIIGAVASRMYAYERVLEDLAEADPCLRADLGELIRATPLPASVPSSFDDELDANPT